VSIPRFVAAELGIVVAGRGPDKLVFESHHGGVLRSSNFRRDVFGPAARAAGLDGLVPHALRRTAASLAIAAGADVKANAAVARPLPGPGVLDREHGYRTAAGQLIPEF
jgi:integrase